MLKFWPNNPAHRYSTTITNLKYVSPLSLDPQTKVVIALRLYPFQSRPTSNLFLPSFLTLARLERERRIGPPATGGRGRVPVALVVALLRVAVVRVVEHHGGAARVRDAGHVLEAAGQAQGAQARGDLLVDLGGVGITPREKEDKVERCSQRSQSPVSKRNPFKKYRKLFKTTNGNNTDIPHHFPFLA